MLDPLGYDPIQCCTNCDSPAADPPADKWCSRYTEGLILPIVTVPGHCTGGEYICFCKDSECMVLSLWRCTMIEMQLLTDEGHFAGKLRRWVWILEDTIDPCVGKCLGIA
jgi:hypothetical protein